MSFLRFLVFSCMAAIVVTPLTLISLWSCDILQIRNPPHYITKSPRRENIVTFFYQGNSISRTQAVFYTGGDPVWSQESAERGLPGAKMRGAPRLLHNIYIYPEPPERNAEYPSLFDRSNDLAFLFFGVENANSKPYLNRHNMSTGGVPDIMHHQKYLRMLFSENGGEKKIVLFGCSRGAAVTMMSVATLPPDEQEKIALVILESPYDSISNITRAYVKHYASLSKISEDMILPWVYPQYAHNQLSPLDIASVFPKTVPVAFVSSAFDFTVPHNNVQNLVDRVRESGHPDLHHLILENSIHSLYPIQDTSEGGDRMRYQSFVDDLYDKYL